MLAVIQVYKLSNVFESGNKKDYTKQLPGIILNTILSFNLNGFRALSRI